MSAQVCQVCTAAYSIGAPQCPECGANNPRPLGDEPNGPSVTVQCDNQDCPDAGVKRVVPLRLAVEGVVERPPLHCAGCDWALRLANDDEQEGDDMPKVTKEGGPSIEGTPETNVELANGDLVHLDADTTEQADEGGEQSSQDQEADGTTSSTSSKKDATGPETSTSEAPSRARTTGNRSGKGRTGSSTAPGTAGDQTAPTSDSDKG